MVLVGFVAAIVIGGGNAKADFTFGTPTNLGPTVNSSSGDSVNCFSADGLEMYLDSPRSGGYGDWDIWVARRATTNEPWGEPVNLGPLVNGPQEDSSASISFDGLKLYFTSKNRPGGYGEYDIWVTKRQTKDAEWGTPVNLGPIVNSSSGEGAPWISTNGLELYFPSYRAGGYGSHDIWVTRRETKNDPWGEPVNLGVVVNSSASECFPFVSADGLLLLFSEGHGSLIRPRGSGNMDIWFARRASDADPWGTPVNPGPIVNSPSLDGAPRISPDGFTLYFGSERPGSFGRPWGDIWQAPIIPIVDFNDDGIADIDDLLILIEHWGTNETLCDIGPMPWGDGIVDVQDLEVLMSYWGQEFEFLPFDLLAHWKLDETEGTIAFDSAGEHEGTLYGEPLWQPTGGQIDGALAFDGTDDYVSTDFVLNPADGPFSVFGWIKEGAPGQAIVSQADRTVFSTTLPGSTWLGTDPAAGKLMTRLMPRPLGRSIPSPLVSEFVITDGAWHRIGFVWEGSCRYLYVDGAEVAKDAESFSQLEGSGGGLYLGAGKNLEPGSLFSGLIDDVRVYNRAITP